MRTKKPPAWIKEDALVDYHAVIGGPITQRRLLVRIEPELMGRQWVCWLKGKSGCVAVEALSPAAPTVLNIRGPSYCARDGRGEFTCVQCKGNEPPGCDMRIQGGYLYGWSDSNCQYELLGEVATP